MASLPVGTPLGNLARILHAASVLGPFAWGGGAHRRAPGGPAEGGVGGGGSGDGASTLSGDLLALFTLLRDRSVPRLLVGGIALLKYIDGRNTDDVDLLISSAGLAKVPEIVIADRNNDFARGTFRSLRVDILLTENPLFRLVHEGYATTHRFNEIEVPVATAAGLVILKLYALPSVYKQSDLQRAALYETDIAMLCQRCQLALPPLLASVRTHVEPGQFEELARIAAEIEARLARMNAHKGV
ncbi:MAG: hypothetical protein ACKVS8_07160 [Phycisphaerales bacterium]